MRRAVQLRIHVYTSVLQVNVNKRVVMWCQHSWEGNCCTNEAMQFNISHLSQPRVPPETIGTGKGLKPLNHCQHLKFVRNC